MGILFNVNSEVIVMFFVLLRIEFVSFAGQA